MKHLQWYRSDGALCEGDLDEDEPLYVDVQACNRQVLEKGICPKCWQLLQDFLDHVIAMNVAAAEKRTKEYEAEPMNMMIEGFLDGMLKAARKAGQS